MKRVAVMQPYFFPYIGYWQLIAAVDYFELFDTVQYTKQSWVARNRILHPAAGWQYIQVPVAAGRLNTPILEAHIAPSSEWKAKLVGQLSHYRKIAPYFGETMALVDDALGDGTQTSLAALNHRIVATLCSALGIATQIGRSSANNADHRAHHRRCDRSLHLLLDRGADCFINPIDGIALLDLEEFERSGIEVWALTPPTISYPQAGRGFEPSLSIIDVLMFNGLATTSGLIKAPCLARVSAANPESQNALS